MGYKMNNGSKNYTIKSYRDGGLVKTTSYKDGGKVEKENIAPVYGEGFKKLDNPTSRQVHRAHFDSEPPMDYEDLGGITKHLYEKSVKKSMADTVKKARDAKPK
jgi:hypothetical protein